MSQAISLKLRGLYTLPNQLGSVPEGALTVADNVVIDAEDLAAPRRGFGRLEYSFADINDRANKLFVYQDKILAHYGTDSLAYYNSGSGWVDYSGTYSPISSLHKVRSAQANSNFYFTTDEGVMVLDAYSGTPSFSGMVKGLDCEATLTGASGFMTNDSQVAYRVVWGFKDANNNLVLGAPSQRAVVSNSTGGTRDVSLQITIPDGVDTTFFFQVYRSPMSADASTEPSDEMGLVYEANPTAGEIIAKSITITDSTPEDLRGVTLYTSPSQEGLVQSNESPPMAKDIAEFKGSLFFANTKSKHRLTFTILAVGGSSGIAINDVLTIAGTTYTGKATENVSNREFEVVTGGTAAQNIADTALSLVRVINQNSTNTTVYAQYLPSTDELPGKILIEERGIGGASFSIIASAHGSAYNPQLPTSGTTVSSSNDEYKNGIFISKYQQPEAVPLTNVLFCGSASKEILRIVPLRDSLLVLKEDGIWRITGDTPSNFASTILDGSTRIISPDSAVVLNNTVFAFTDQSVVSISDTGVQVVSRAVENSLTELIGKNLSVLTTESFAVSYESERKYILFVPSTEADTYPTQAFVYNTFTNAWTRWPLSKKCGVVNSDDDKLYLGNADSKYVVQERKSYSFRDYIDEGDDYTLSSYTGTTLTISGGVSGIEVGDLVYQSSSVNSPIVSVDSGAGTVTVNDTLTWTVGTVTIYKGIDCAVEWVPQTAGNPGNLKHFREMTLLFKKSNFTTAQVGFYSDASGSLEETNITGNFGGLWGLFPWGSIPWGGVQKPKPIRTYVPLEKARCSQLSTRFSHRVGYGTFELAGASIVFNFGSERVAR